MKKTIYLIIAAAALISCSKSEPAEVNADELRFDISYPATKATASSFESGARFRSMQWNMPQTAPRCRFRSAETI